MRRGLHSLQRSLGDTGHCELHARSLLRLNYGSVGMTPRWKRLEDWMIPDLGMSWLGWAGWIGNWWWAAGTWSHFCSGRFLSKGYASHRGNKTCGKVFQQRIGDRAFVSGFGLVDDECNGRSHSESPGSGSERNGLVSPVDINFRVLR